MSRVAFIAVLAGAVIISACESSGGSSGYRSSNSFYYGYGNTWYDDPNYWYDDPDYVVVPPPRPERPGDRPSVENPIVLPDEPGPVRPEQPIARPQPVGPELSSRESSYRSRMPESQPRMSRPSSRQSIPSRSRGGGFRGGGRRR